MNAMFAAMMGGGGKGSASGAAEKPGFPIKNDPNLGPVFTHTQLASACCTGDKEILEYFLENYPDLLEVPYGESVYPLYLTAFAYIRGEPFREITPSIEGFKILAEQDIITKNFKIEAGDGIIDFDEWLLQEASYKDRFMQDRLIQLQKILISNLSADRLSSLENARKRKAKREQDKEVVKLNKTNSRNKIVAFALGLVAVGASYWLYSRSKVTRGASAAATAVL